MEDFGAVEFVLHMPQAHSVAVAGTFNNWSPDLTPMHKGGDGVWRGKMQLAPGRYEYRFVVDGQWMDDPKAQESVPNSYGGRNSVVVVEAKSRRRGFALSKW